MAWALARQALLRASAKLGYMPTKVQLAEVLELDIGCVFQLAAEHEMQKLLGFRHDGSDWFALRDPKPCQCRSNATIWACSAGLAATRLACSVLARL